MNGNINVLAFSGEYLFAGCGYYSGESNVFRTAFNDTSWTDVSTSLPSTSGVYSLAVSGTNIFAGTYDGGVYRSTDNGTTWNAINNGLKNTMVKALAVSGTNLFAGTDDGGVFLSTDNGTNWAPVNSGLTSTQIVSLEISDGYLFAGTHNGLWKRPLSEMITSVEINPTDAPTHFSLEQNYPNPFNPATTIQYSIAHSGRTQLHIYTVLRREVATLVNTVQQPGTYSVEWDASGIPSGVYFYRLQAGTYTDTKRLTLIK